MYQINNILNTIIQGNTLEVLKNIPDNSINMVITSPPYWGLRCYNTNPQVWDGDENCEHEWDTKIIRKRTDGDVPGKNSLIAKYRPNNIVNRPDIISNTCIKCGAWKGELGNEPTYEMYINHLIQIFDEVYRVLKDDGTCWVNLGDSYARSNHCGIKPKSLVGIPDRFKIAMIDRGWICRNDIIWCLDENTKIFVKEIDKYKLKKISEIKKEDCVPTQNKNGETIWTKVKNIYNNGQKECLKIITKSGREVICTSEHQFVTIASPVRGNTYRKIRIKKACELRKNDYFILNEKFDIDLPQGNENDYSNGFIVGFFLAEGNYIKNQTNKKIYGIQLSCGIKDIENKYIEYFKNYNFKVYQYGNNVVIHSRDVKLLKLIQYYTDGDVCTEKHLTNNVFNCSINFIKGIIDGFLAGDGSYDIQNNRYRVSIAPNEMLKDEIMLLCRILGYQFRFESVRDNGYKGVMTFTIRKVPKQRRYLDCIHDQIDKIEFIGIKNVYDIEIEPIYTSYCGKNKTDKPSIDNRKTKYNHLYFLANGLWTHNCKPNAMPESVKDRFTDDYERLFFFTKNRKYYFEQQFEPMKAESEERYKYAFGASKKMKIMRNINGSPEGIKDFKQYKGRNKRTVWSISTKSFKGAHFAVFPEELIETPIKAGCPENGIVMDIFMGSGTTAVVAQKLNRNYIGIELNPEYIKIAENRINNIKISNY